MRMTIGIVAATGYDRGGRTGGGKELGAGGIAGAMMSYLQYIYPELPLSALFLQSPGCL
jgi:hypothetical protein